MKESKLTESVSCIREEFQGTIDDLMVNGTIGPKAYVTDIVSLSKQHGFYDQFGFNKLSLA